MKSAKIDPKKVEKKNSSEYLSLGFICLLIGGTFAAKTLLLVDNDLEIKTKFAGKSWQVNSQSIQKYASDSQKFVSQHLNPLRAKLRQQSNQLLVRAGKVRVDRQDLCDLTSKFSTVLDRAKSANSIDSNNPTSPKFANNQVVKTANRSNPNGNRPLHPNPSVPSWCVTSRVKK